jgi:hypothetical protein
MFERREGRSGRPHKKYGLSTRSALSRFAHGITVQALDLLPSPKEADSYEGG